MLDRHLQATKTQPKHCPTASLISQLVSLLADPSGEDAESVPFSACRLRHTLSRASLDLSLIPDGAISSCCTARPTQVRVPPGRADRARCFRASSPATWNHTAVLGVAALTYTCMQCEWIHLYDADLNSSWLHLPEDCIGANWHQLLHHVSLCHCLNRGASPAAQ